MAPVHHASVWYSIRNTTHDKAVNLRDSNPKLSYPLEALALFAGIIAETYHTHAVQLGNEANDR